MGRVPSLPAVAGLAAMLVILLLAGAPGPVNAAGTAKKAPPPRALRPARAPPTVLGFLSHRTDMTMLQSFIQTSGLTNTFLTVQNANAPMTLLAPTDIAFNKALKALRMTKTDLLSDKNLMSQIVMNHIVLNKNYSLSSMRTGTQAQTMGGKIKFSAKGRIRLVSSVGSNVLPVATATNAIPVGPSAIVVLDEALLPAGVKPVPLPAPPPAPPPGRKTRPPSSGGGHIGGGSSATNYYLGCFADGAYTTRVLPTVLLSSSGSLTRNTCAAAAAAAGLTYFGMQGGNMCYGGSNLAMATSQGASAACTTACTGDASQICGGTNANVLFSLAPPTSPTPSCTSYSCYVPLGCFVEPFCSTGTRGLASGQLQPKQLCSPATATQPASCNPAPASAASVSACSDLAKAYNYKYFSVQYGVECYASNSTAYAMSKGLSTACTMPCGADSSVTCGGNCANQIYQVDYGLAPAPAPPASPNPAPVTCASSLSCLIDFTKIDTDGASFPAIASRDADTGHLFQTFPLSRFLKASMKLSAQAICALAVKGSTLNSWSVSGMAPSWAQGFLNTVSVTGLMDSLNLFSQVPVNPEQYYFIGLQVIGVPGFDFLSPIGTSGVTIAGAFNPCVSDYSFAFAGLAVAIEVPTPVGIQVDVGANLNQLAFSKNGAIDPAVYPNLGLPASWWTPAGQRALSMKGNMYISGGLSVSVGINNNPIAIELAGTGTQLLSYTGGVGYSTSISAAPSILLLDGAIKINLASVAQATSSLFFRYVNANDFTVALQTTLTLDPGLFLGTIIPNLPSVVSETLGLLFNLNPIKSVDFFAGMATGWWGASMQIQGIGGFGALLGAFNFIAQEAGFPLPTNFQPRFSIAGKLTGNGLPIAIGLDYKDGSGNSTKWLYFCDRDGDCPSGYKCMSPKGLKSVGGVCGSISCAANRQLVGALCYDPCPSGYRMVLGTCWQICPSGYDDTGLFCTKADYPACRSGYTGVGPVCWGSCPSDCTDIGATCYCKGDTKGKSCCKKWGKCWSKCCGGCPSGYTDTGCTCQRWDKWVAKDSYGRGLGLTTIAKDSIFRQPYLPIFAMPPSSTISGSTATTSTANNNPAQCSSADCIMPLGCYADSAVRAVPTSALRTIVSGSTSYMANAGWTPFTCAAEAKKNNGILFGVQNGGECWYGTDLAAAIALGRSTACTMLCTADTTKTCGGPWANSVYTIV